MRSLAAILVLLSAWAAHAEDSIEVRNAITGLGDVEQVGDVALLPEGAEPTVSLVGYLELGGEFDAASVIADDIDRDVVAVEKQSDRQWIILGEGKVFIVATLVTRDPLSIEQRRYTVTIGKPEEPDEPDDPVDPDHPEAELIKQVRDWAAEVDDEAGAQALALVYRQVAESVTQGDVSASKAVDVVRNASNAALASVGSQADWTEFRSRLSGVFGDRINQGLFSTPKQVSGVFVAVAEGLIATAAARSMSLDESSAIIHGAFRAIKRYGQ